MRSVVSFFVRLKILEGVFTNFSHAFYFTRSKVMSHHDSLHDSPLQESGSAGLSKINLPSKLTPGKHPNLAPNFGSCISRSVSILRPEERLTHFFTKKIRRLGLHILIPCVIVMVCWTIKPKSTL